MFCIKLGGVGMLKLFKRMKNEESGQALVLVALMMVVLMGFAALAIDVGRLYSERTSLQVAADAAALAGAMELPNKNTAESIAVHLAKENGKIKEGDSIIANTPFDEDLNKIEVVFTRTVQFSFARFLQISQSDITVRAVAEKKEAVLSNSTFDYAVFAGDAELKWNGGNFVIGGDIYGDKGIQLTGMGSVIDGHVVYGTGSVSVGGIYEGSPTQKKETMPDFSTLVKEQATANGNHFPNQVEFKEKYYDQPEVPATEAVYKNNGDLLTPANPGSPAIMGADIDGPIWVSGDLDIDQPIHGKGIIYADGIYKYSYNDVTSPSMASICFYSENDIIFNGGSGKISGILYAPNGTIEINGTPQENKVFGRMISKDVTVNGNGYTIISRDSDLEWMDTLTMKPIYKLVE